MQPDDSTAEVATSSPVPLVVFDGDCGFCRKSVAWLQGWAGDRVDAIAYQDSDDPRLDPEACSRAVHLIEPDGRITRAAEACFRALRYVPGMGWPWWIYRLVPLAETVSEAGYRFVAEHRVGISKLVRVVSGPDPEPPTYRIARRAFTVLLGIAFFAAFVSLWRQADGLIGSGGILPMADRLGGAQGSGLWWRVPTVFWLAHTDQMMHLVLGVGTAAAVALTFGFAPRLALFVAWALYLSLTNVGDRFTGYQWDSLLLETGLIALLVVPGGAWPRERWRERPRFAGRLLLKFLLLRLFLASAVVKWRDPVWRQLDALDYHYWTQPLPSWISWYADRLPAAFQEFSVAAMFVVQAVLPFLAFGPRRFRGFAFVGMLTLQLLIALTGNYGFFNLTAAALCLWLVDDQTFRRFLPGRLTAGAATIRHARWLERLGTRVATLALLTIGTLVFVGQRPGGIDLAPPLERVLRVAASYHVANGYGLFGNMTETRPELIVEGSRNGEDWRAFELPYKPGDVERAPPIVGLHMPRLDWQMWFAALHVEGGRLPRWVERFAGALLRGQPAVLGLLAEDPFDAPPRYVRVRLFQYRFADSARREQGAWWQRTEVGTVAVWTLDGGEVARVR